MWWTYNNCFPLTEKNGIIKHTKKHNLVVKILQMKILNFAPNYFVKNGSELPESSYQR